MSDIEEIMSLDVTNLAKKQYDTLKEYAIDRLQAMVSFLEADDFENARSMLANSPSGDGWGCDNTLIEFPYRPRDSGNPVDIGYVIDDLKRLLIQSKQSAYDDDDDLF